MKTPEIRAIELFHLVHGKDTPGREFYGQSPEEIRGWIKLGKFVLNLETKWTSAKHDAGALRTIAKICRHSKQYEDPISDILCECNRANRLAAAKDSL